jgi:phage terminase small subunit
MKSLSKCEKKLSIKDRKTVKGIINGKPVSKAMIEAGYAETTAHGKCSEKLKELQITLQALMDQKGLSDDKLLDVLEAGLEAVREGARSTLLTDYGTRHRYLETALKLKGHLRDKVDVDVNFDFADRLHQARMNARMEAGLIPTEATGGHSNV